MIRIHLNIYSTYILLLYSLMDVHVAQPQAQLARLSDDGTIGGGLLIL